MMKRWILLLEMALLLGVIAAVIVLCSPYAPPVEPMRDIEELWAIEDAREESEEPLVTKIENFGVPLGYDRAGNTFYCTLGLDTGEEWPEIKLTLPKADGVSVCFVDDYTYDWCAEAIAEGYSYELMAYDDTHYGYFNLVFTGLPIVTLHTSEEITREKVEGVCTIADASQPSVAKAAVRTRLRGDGTLRNLEKKSYRIEFMRGATDSTEMNVPGLGMTDAVNMLCMGFDPTFMRDQLSWNVLARVQGERETFTARPTQYAEFFVNDEYWGLYTMSTSFEPKEEMAKAGSGALSRDRLYRTTSQRDSNGHPTRMDPDNDISYEALYYPTEGTALDGIDPYIALRYAPDDETFIEMAEKHIDLDSMLNYVVFLQAFALTDNTSKNMYIWQHYEDGDYRYRFELWDMDRSWDLDPGQMGDIWYAQNVLDRVINLDVNGARRRFAEIWEEIKARGLNVELVETLVRDYERQISQSGAFYREVERWGLEDAYLRGDRVIDCARLRFEWMDLVTKFIAEAEGDVEFLDVGEREEAHLYPTWGYLNGEK